MYFVFFTIPSFLYQAENINCIISAKNKLTIITLDKPEHIDQGPVVQSVVSLTSLLRAISLTILADSVYNFLKFFAEKM